MVDRWCKYWGLKLALQSKGWCSGKETAMPNQYLKSGVIPEENSQRDWNVCSIWNISDTYQRDRWCKHGSSHGKGDSACRTTPCWLTVTPKGHQGHRCHMRWSRGRAPSVHGEALTAGSSFCVCVARRAGSKTGFHPLPQKWSNLLL